MFVYLFNWSCWVFSVAGGIFSLHCDMWTLGCGMWDLVPWPGIEPGPTALGTWSLSHGTTREVPGHSQLWFFFFFKTSNVAKLLWKGTSAALRFLLSLPSDKAFPTLEGLPLVLLVMHLLYFDHMAFLLFFSFWKKMLILLPVKFRKS